MILAKYRWLRPTLLLALLIVAVLFLVASSSFLEYSITFLLSLILSYNFILELWVGMAFISPGNKKKMFTETGWSSSYHKLSTQIHAKSHFDEIKRPLVIIIHGWRSGAISMKDRAETYLKMGMHVIIFEMPGHGASEPVAKWTAGHAAVTFHEFFESLESQFNMDLVSKIFLHGHSMGGFVLLKFNKLATPTNQLDKVCGYILESPLTCYSFIFEETIKQLFIPRFLVNHYWKRLRLHFNTVNPKLTSVEDITEVDIPFWGSINNDLLLIQAEQDDVLGRRHYDRLVNVQSDLKENRFTFDEHLVPSLTHAQSRKNIDRDAIIEDWVKERIHSDSLTSA